MKVLIIGAGVNGLSVAYQLQRNGFSVTIVTESIGRGTVSTVAGALWEMPPAVCGFFKDLPEVATALERNWAIESLMQFQHMAKKKVPGVYLRRVNFYLDRPLAQVPGETEKFKLLDDLDVDLSITSPQKQNSPVYSSAYSYLAPQIDTDRYLSYLLDSYVNSGGSILNQKVGTFRNDLDNLARQTGAELIVNCTGLGASQMVPDDSLVPVRGGWFSVLNDGTHFPRFTEAHCTSLHNFNGAFMFLLPRGENQLVIGGIAQPYQWSTDLQRDSSEIQEMLNLCFESFPCLEEADFEEADFRVGLRPFRRAGVRLDLDRITYSVPVISNYGHGGAGVLLSWGCAFSVLSFARQIRADLSVAAHSKLQANRPKVVC